MTRIGTYAHTEQGYEAINFGDYEVKSHEAE